MLEMFTFLFVVANSIMLVGLSLFALADHDLVSPQIKEKINNCKKFL